ncbi:hypothetical protein HN51_020087 [Arachis hypogaea]
MFPRGKSWRISEPAAPAWRRQLLRISLKYVFLSPCPQRALFSAIDVLLLFTFYVFAIIKLYQRLFSNGNNNSSNSITSNGHNNHHNNELNKPLIRNNRNFTKITTLWFKLTLIATSVLAALFIVASSLVFNSSIIQAPWKVLDGVFWLVQAIKQIVLAIMIIHKKIFEAVNHLVSLRIYWIASFIVYSFWGYTFLHFRC